MLPNELSDRRWRREMAANPVSKESEPFKPKRLPAVRVHSIVRHSQARLLLYLVTRISVGGFLFLFRKVLLAQGLAFLLVLG